jgi:hypothetical protein
MQRLTVQFQMSLFLSIQLLVLYKFQLKKFKLRLSLPAFAQLLLILFQNILCFHQFLVFHGTLLFILDQLFLQSGIIVIGTFQLLLGSLIVVSQQFMLFLLESALFQEMPHLLFSLLEHLLYLFLMLSHHFAFFLQ